MGVRGEALAAACSVGNLRAFAVCGDTRFPHMSPADSSIWQVWWSQQRGAWDEAFYDVRVGGPGKAKETRQEGVGVPWVHLLSKRVDVVLRRGDFYCVVEVKPLASLAALGQVLVYQSLLRREWVPGKEVGAVVVCRLVDPDVRVVGERLGVVFEGIEGDAW